MRRLHRTAIVFVSLLFLTIFCYGQQGTSASASPAALGHGAFPIKVSKTLDSSKLKEGDTVELETAGSFKLADGTLVPKGSRMEGHVTSAKARSKGDADSELTLAFDKLNIQGGRQLTLKGSVQAVYPPADEPMGPNMATAGTSAGGSARGSTVGGGGVNSGGVGLTDAKNGSDMQSSSSGQQVMDMKATGVQGIHDLSLDNGVISSKGKNVKLGSGVRMVVKVDILG
jgi:hypothetical protein